MAIKVIITPLGQQVIAEVKQIENKDTKQVVGYLLENPRLVSYQKGESEGEVAVNFAPYCLLSDDAEVSIRPEFATSIVTPRQEVIDNYSSVVLRENPPEAPEETPAQVEVVGNESSDSAVEEG